VDKTNNNHPTTITLKQSAPGGDENRSTINLVKPDSLLYIDSLLPNTTYSFHAAIQPSNQAEVKSNVPSVATLDTTNHNFTFETFTFGEHSSSILFDVAIIDENNIWAVGEIYMNDSLGQPDPHAYNAVHWDGNEWLPQKITVEFRGNLITPALYGVFAFSNNDIWFSSGVPIRGDGENWTQYHLFDMGILGQDDGSLKKIWGSNSENVYFVGNKGTIVHYQNGNWTKIESETDLHIYDI